MVLQEVYNSLKKNSKPRMIIGITGSTGSGKTFFSKELAQFLKENGTDSATLISDMYTSSSRADRNSVIESLENMHDPHWPRKAYPQSEALMIEHLKNLKHEKNFSAPNLCNPTTKNLDFSLDVSFDSNSITLILGDEKNKYDKNNLWIICEGTRIIKYKELFDSVIFLKADPQTRFNRLLDRNSKSHSPAKIKRNLFDDVEKYLIEDYNLEDKHADIVIDNNDFSNRKIITS